MSAAVVERLRFAALTAATWAGRHPHAVATEMAQQLAALHEAHRPDLPPHVAADLDGIVQGVIALPALVAEHDGSDLRSPPAHRARELAQRLADFHTAHWRALTPGLALELAACAHALAALADLIDDTAPPRGRPTGLPLAEEA